MIRPLLLVFVCGCYFLSGPDCPVVGSDTRAGDAVPERATQSSFGQPEVDECVNRAVDWLLDYCCEGRKIQAAMGNDAAKNDVVILQTAYLLTIKPNLFAQDERREKVIKMAERVLAHGVSRHFAFESWVSGFGGIYASEVSTRSGQPHPALEDLADSWIARQNIEGGWSHGGAGKMVGFYPNTIISAANFALIGLGACQQFDCDIAESLDFEDVVDEAFEMYASAQSSRGGFPYGAKSYQKGVQSGRSATSLIGLAALNKQDTDLFCRASYFVVNNIETIPFGHASPAMHVGCGAMALAMLGGKHWERYRAAHFPRLMAIQKQDGSFGDFVDGPDSMIGDETVSAAYRTALYAMCFTANESEYVKRLASQLNTTSVLERGETLVKLAHPDLPKAPAQTDVVSGFELAGDELLLGVRPGSKGTADRCLVGSIGSETVTLKDATTGKVIGKINLSRPLSSSQQVKFDAKRIYVIDLAEPQMHQPKEGANKNGESGNDKVAAEFGVECFNWLDGERVWFQEVGLLKRYFIDGENLIFISQSGSSLGCIELVSGRLKFRESTVGAITNAGLAAATRGESFVGGMGRVAKHRADGAKVWNSRIRGKRGIVPPATVSLVLLDNSLFVSTADGRLSCLDSDSGAVKWRYDCNGIVRLIRGRNGELLALGSNGLLQRYATSSDAEKRVMWSRNVGAGIETISESESSSDQFQVGVIDGAVCVEDTIEQTLTILDAKSGQPLSVLGCNGFRLTDDSIYVQKGRAIQRIQLKNL